MFNLLKYIILGLVQGITEPLPISSSGHLVLAQDLLKLDFNDLNLEIILNFASLLAIIFFYRTDIVSLVKNNYAYVVKREQQHKRAFVYLLLIILATIPAVIGGFLLKDFIEVNLKNSLTVGISLLFTALALFIINRYGKNNNKTEITPLDATIMGLAQAVALTPGISRSGSTLVAGLSRKIESSHALKFSFLMYIPISIGAMILTLKDLDITTFTTEMITGYAIAFIITALATYFALKLLYRIVKTATLHYFSYYCVAAGIFGILLGLNVI